MTPQKKNYTNADIIKRLDHMDTRISALEVYKIAQDAGREAVDEYKRQEQSDKERNSKDSLMSGAKDIIPYVVALLIAAAAYIYVKASGK